MKKFNFKINNQLLQLVTLVLVGVATRTVFHIAPNFEFVTGLVLVAATRLKQPYSILTPALVLLISDYIIGNSAIFVFTWSGFAVTYLISWIARRNINRSHVASRLLKYEGLGVVSVLFFYFWTNYGVMLQSGMYPNTLEGYTQSLIMALPFLKVQLQSVLITVPIVYLLSEGIKQMVEFGGEKFTRNYKLPSITGN